MTVYSPQRLDVLVVFTMSRGRRGPSFYGLHSGFISNSNADLGRYSLEPIGVLFIVRVPLLVLQSPSRVDRPYSKQGAWDESACQCTGHFP